MNHPVVPHSQQFCLRRTPPSDTNLHKQIGLPRLRCCYAWFPPERPFMSIPNQEETTRFLTQGAWTNSRLIYVLVVGSKHRNPCTALQYMNEGIHTRFIITSQRFRVILLMAEFLHQLRLVVYPIIYKGLYISGGCFGFLPSTVVWYDMARDLSRNGPESWGKLGTHGITLIKMWPYTHL